MLLHRKAFGYGMREKWRGGIKNIVTCSLNELNLKSRHGHKMPRSFLNFFSFASCVNKITLLKMFYICIKKTYVVCMCDVHVCLSYIRLNYLIYFQRQKNSRSNDSTVLAFSNKGHIHSHFNPFSLLYIFCTVWNKIQTRTMAMGPKLHNCMTCSQLVDKISATQKYILLNNTPLLFSPSKHYTPNRNKQKYFRRALFSKKRISY